MEFTSSVHLCHIREHIHHAVGTQVLEGQSPWEVDHTDDRWHRDRAAGEDSLGGMGPRSGLEPEGSPPRGQVLEEESDSVPCLRNTRVWDFDHDSHKDQGLGCNHEGEGHVDRIRRIGEAHYCKVVGPQANVSDRDHPEEAYLAESTAIRVSKKALLIYEGLEKEGVTNVGNALDSISLKFSTIELVYSGSKVGSGLILNKAGGQVSTRPNYGSNGWLGQHTPCR